MHSQASAATSSWCRRLPRSALLSCLCPCLESHFSHKTDSTCMLLNQFEFSTSKANSIICPAKPSSCPQPEVSIKTMLVLYAFNPVTPIFLVGLIFFPPITSWSINSHIYAFNNALSLRVVPESSFFLPLTQPSPLPQFWVTCIWIVPLSYQL